MAAAGSAPALYAVGAALLVLLVAGVAALVHLGTRPHARESWQNAVDRLAADSPWRWRDLGWLLMLLVVAQAARRLLPRALVWDLLAFHGVLAIGIVWRARGKVRPFGHPMRWRRAAGAAAIRWLAALPVLWFFAFVWRLALAAAGQSPDLQKSMQLFLDAPDLATRAAFVFFAVAVAPVAEEALFRGILLPLFARRAGAFAAVAISSLVFAAMHADLGTFVPLAAYACALAVAHARCGSLRVPVAMHVVFNGVNLCLLLGLLRAGAPI